MLDTRVMSENMAIRVPSRRNLSVPMEHRRGEQGGLSSGDG
jgi:hypothetical protein